MCDQGTSSGGKKHGSPKLSRFTHRSPEPSLKLIRQERRSQLRRKSVNKISRRALWPDEDRYYGIFAALAHNPSEEIALVRTISVPLIQHVPIKLPYNLDQTVADNCLTLSGMGYYLGIGSCCPTCTANSGRTTPNSREALILAFVQQINTIFEHRAFLASVKVLAERQQTALPTLLGGILAQPELFFVHTILRTGDSSAPRLLFYADPLYGGHMLYVVFPGTSIHLHYRIIDRMLTACPSYKFIAHVWQTLFVLVVRRGTEKPTDGDIPAVSASDIYCKMQDINFDGGFLSEYQKLYTTFDEFPPP
ncbi:nuclear egress lamina protein [Macropodid alphaherpesvirus 4]|uniref:Nuclear egress lamina protein n=1 Tax=Macropodid alphaherpesvirus 4 TaxID=2762721 RepID=A0A7L7YSF1_9ALPH|nr:nuclear egress lamina protein [Macropodid alphaherpesvirus 4]QOD40164.1 nuclear egress lamina protein [Macropodid alphaherpesvirus 4]